MEYTIVFVAERGLPLPAPPGVHCVRSAAQLPAHAHHVHDRPAGGRVSGQIFNNSYNTAWLIRPKSYDDFAHVTLLSMKKMRDTLGDNPSRCRHS